MKPKFTAHGDSFVIENYNHAMPFSDFFPALAGVTGKPMWVFTSNRGQGISSFGINNKDGAMLEFLPANKAYHVTPSLGFRTFIKTTRDSQVYEPFVYAMDARHQTMRIRPYELEISDRSPSTGLESHVVFYGVPGETCAVLARSLTLTNTSNKPLPISIVDGLPRVKPWGMNDYLVKNIIGVVGKAFRRHMTCVCEIIASIQLIFIHIIKRHFKFLVCYV
jgi:hypothetical protein